MAIPFLLPLLLSGGSVIANSMAANAQAKAQAAAMEAERIRQRQYDTESYALNDASRNRYEDFQTQQADRSSQLADMFKSTTDAPPAEPVAALPQSSSNLVVQNDAKQSADAKAKTNAQADRRGAVESFGDLFGTISRAQGRDAGQLGMIGSLRRGSQNVLPLELQAAQEKGRGWMLLGDLLNLGAGLTTMPALTGTSLFGGPQLVSGPGLGGGWFSRAPTPTPRPVMM